MARIDDRERAPIATQGDKPRPAPRKGIALPKREDPSNDGNPLNTAEGDAAPIVDEADPALGRRGVYLKLEHAESGGLEDSSDPVRNSVPFRNLRQR